MHAFTEEPRTATVQKAYKSSSANPLLNINVEQPAASTSLGISSFTDNIQAFANLIPKTAETFTENHEQFKIFRISWRRCHLKKKIRNLIIVVSTKHSVESSLDVSLMVLLV